MLACIGGVVDRDTVMQLNDNGETLVPTTVTTSATLPEWMQTTGKAMAERADSAVVRAKLKGPLSAKSVCELYRKMSAKNMQKWALARDGRENEQGNTNPKKPKEFKNMYPFLSHWMEEKGFSLKTQNVTPKAIVMTALANAVKVD